MENTKISWATHTFNPWMGCTKVSEGCAHCYAENLMDYRMKRVKWGKGAERIRTSKTYWNQPRKWDIKAANAEFDYVSESLLHDEGDLEPYDRPRVFCASLSDVFDEEVDPKWRMDLFNLISECPNLDWLLLTKRPQNIYIPLIAGAKNIWIGVSVENQNAANERIPILLDIPAQVRFLSVEPMLGPIHFGIFTTKRRNVDWVICGGESGQRARPMNEEWARDLMHQCKNERIAFFMKQMGGVRDKRGRLIDMPEDLQLREIPNGLH